MRGRVVIAAAEDSHGAVRVVDEVGERHEGVAERLARADAPLLVQRQHPLEQVDELPPVDLLRQQLGAFEVGRDVDLSRGRGEG